MELIKVQVNEKKYTVGDNMGTQTATPLGLQTNQNTMANTHRLRSPEPLFSAPKLDLGSRNQAKNQAAGFTAAASGLASGFQVNPQTTSPLEAGIDVLGATAGGALSGAAAGSLIGPLGAVGGALLGGGTALLIGGAKAYFGVSATRKAVRERKRLAERAERAQAEAMRKQEAWNERTRLDTLRQKDEDRAETLIQQGWIDYNNKLAFMTNMVNQSKQGQQHLQSLIQPTS